MALASVETLSDEDQHAVTTPCPAVPKKDDEKSASPKTKTEKTKPKAKAKSKVAGKGSGKKATGATKGSGKKKVESGSAASTAEMSEKPKPKPKAKSEKPTPKPKAKLAALKRPASAAAGSPPMKKPAGRDPDQVSTGKGLYKNGVWGIKLNKKEVIRVKPDPDIPAEETMRQTAIQKTQNQLKEKPSGVPAVDEETYEGGDDAAEGEEEELKEEDEIEGMQAGAWIKCNQLFLTINDNHIKFNQGSMPLIFSQTSCRNPQKLSEKFTNMYEISLECQDLFGSNAEDID
eukprot:s4944_g2.t1